METNTCVEDRDEAARKIVKTYMYWAMGAGLVPVPIFDLMAVSSIQVKMLYDLSKLYNQEFNANLGKSVVGSLIGGLATNELAYGGVGAILLSVAKIIPVVGAAVGIAALPAFAGASTFAVGRIFTMHFEAGGTLLNFDPATMRDHFRAAFKDGEKAAKDVDKKNAAK